MFFKVRAAICCCAIYTLCNYSWVISSHRQERLFLFIKQEMIIKISFKKGQLFLMCIKMHLATNQAVQIIIFLYVALS